MRYLSQQPESGPHLDLQQNEVLQGASFGVLGHKQGIVPLFDHALCVEEAS